MRLTRVSAEQQLHEARVQVARNNGRWTELDPVDLIDRMGGRVVVSATTDEVFARHPGVVFEPGTANAIANMAALYFTVDHDGQLTFLERQPGGLWSEHVRRQAERDARRARSA